MAIGPRIASAGAARESDDVFFLTLVDFLAQVLFFGLLLFVVYQAQSKTERDAVVRDREEISKSIKAAGVSNITELTDELTRLSPTDLKKFNELLKEVGGAEEALALLKRAREEGGARATLGRLDKLARLEGADKPSCLVDQTTRQKLPLATITAVGDRLIFEDLTPQLREVLTKLKTDFGTVKNLQAGQFQRVFSPLLRLAPTCRYFVRFRERTELVAPRRAVGQAFYLMMR